MSPLACPKCGSKATGFSPRTGELVCFENECFYNEGDNNGSDWRAANRSPDPRTGPESSSGT